MKLTSKKTHYVLLALVLILSAYVHLWNPVGFPEIFFDEGIYMRRAINVMETGNPQESNFYDHPYFAQLLLGGLLKITGFNEIVQNDLELSYLIPRVLMGFFAVLDTLLIYKISAKRFNKSTAILASLIFAVLPITWVLRRILLDTILLPLVLSSILLALYAKDSKHQSLFLFGSSALLGLAIFTKITAITIMPIVLYLMYQALSKKNLFGLYAVPIFAIPSIWPVFAMFRNHFEKWLNDVLWQAGRGSGGFLPVTHQLFTIDPIFMSLGFSGLAYAFYKKSKFLIIWMIPFLIFVNLVGYFQYFHYIMIMPVMAISGAYLIQSNLYRIKNYKTAYYVIFTLIVLFGLDASYTLINIDLTKPQFETIEYVNKIMDEKTTLLASPVYSWILSDVYGHDNVMIDYSSIMFYKMPTENHLVISDPHLVYDTNRHENLVMINNYETIHTINGTNDSYEIWNYPYNSLHLAEESSKIAIKSNFDALE